MKELIDFLVKNGLTLLPWFRAHEWNNTMIVRGGRIHRSVAAGLHWKWPILDELKTYSRTEVGLDLAAGTITTADGDSITLSANLSYVVTDLIVNYRAIWNLENTLKLLAIGHITSRGAQSRTQQLTRQRSTMESDLLASLNEIVRPMGINVVRVLLTDCVITRAHRHYVDGVRP